MKVQTNLEHTRDIIGDERRQHPDRAQGDEGAGYTTQKPESDALCHEELYNLTAFSAEGGADRDLMLAEGGPDRLSDLRPRSMIEVSCRS